MLSPKSQDYPCAPCLLHPRTNNVLDIIDEHHILKQLTYPSLLILASHAMSWLWNLRRRQNRACTVWLLGTLSWFIKIIFSVPHKFTQFLCFLFKFRFFYVILFNLLWIHRHTSVKPSLNSSYLHLFDHIYVAKTEGLENTFVFNSFSFLFLYARNVTYFF